MVKGFSTTSTPLAHFHAELLTGRDSAFPIYRQQQESFMEEVLCDGIYI